jgi:transcriptional regulator with XRE-family HTH domain
MDERAKNLGARIRELRLLRGLSQKALAALAGCDQAEVSKWEIGKREPGAFNLLDVASALGVPIGAMFEPAKLELPPPRRGRPKKGEGAPSGGTDTKKRGRGKRGVGGS